MSKGYIRVEIGGKERGLKFSQYAKEIIDEKTHKGTLSSNAKNYYAIFYGGLIGNCSAKEEEPDFTYEDVEEWVDELLIKPEEFNILLLKVIEVIKATQPPENILKVSGDEPEEEKKRPTKKGK